MAEASDLHCALLTRLRKHCMMQDPMMHIDQLDRDVSVWDTQMIHLVVDGEIIQHQFDGRCVEYGWRR